MKFPLQKDLGFTLLIVCVICCGDNSLVNCEIIPLILFGLIFLNTCLTVASFDILLIFGSFKIVLAKPFLVGSNVLTNPFLVGSSVSIKPFLKLDIIK